MEIFLCFTFFVYLGVRGKIYKKRNYETFMKRLLGILLAAGIGLVGISCGEKEEQKYYYSRSYSQSGSSSSSKSSSSKEDELTESMLEMADESIEEAKELVDELPAPKGVREKLKQSIDQAVEEPRRQAYESSNRQSPPSSKREVDWGDGQSHQRRRPRRDEISHFLGRWYSQNPSSLISKAEITFEGIDVYFKIWSRTPRGDSSWGKHKIRDYYSEDNELYIPWITPLSRTTQQNRLQWVNYLGGNKIRISTNTFSLAYINEEWERTSNLRKDSGILIRE